jgi:hypothetical protein
VQRVRPRRVWRREEASRCRSARTATADATVPVKSFSGCPAAAELTAPEASTSCLAGADSPRADASSSTGSCRRAAYPGPRGRSGRGGGLPSSSQREKGARERERPEQRSDGTSCRWRRGCQRSSRRGSGARTGARRQRQDAFWREASARCGGRGRKTAQARLRRMRGEGLGPASGARCRSTA